MRRKKVRLGLGEKTLLEKTDLGYNIVIHCNANTNFPTPSPELADIVGACDAARTAHEAASGGGKELTAIMHQRERELEIVLTAFGSYVDNVAQGDELIILSAGVDATKDPVPSGVPGQVLGLEAKPTQMQGEVKLRFKKVKNAIAYIIYLALVADGPYTQLKITSSTRYIAQGLQSLNTYWFKVQAVGRVGTAGPYSDPASSIAM